MARESSASVRPTLGLTWVTVDAMALIAPGAFLWITYQLQGAAPAPDGSSVATDMWAGIAVALLVALLTALSYAELMRRYPEAGFGSSDLDSDPTKLLEVVEIGKQLLMTRGALTTFSIANDVAKYFAIESSVVPSLHVTVPAALALGPVERVLSAAGAEPSFAMPP